MLNTHNRKRSDTREREAAMTEKEMFLNNWDREHKITLKVLKAFPTDKADLKPAERSRTAKELAWVFVAEQSVMADGVVKGQIDFGGMPAPPALFTGVVSKFESDFPAILDRVRKMSDADYNSMMAFPTGPKQMGQFRKADILWMAVQDMIHHRGQFSVYLRMAGGRVPSIYGPSADEPWT
jgi:uncharacterized damage-inducible protein DinB